MTRRIAVAILIISWSVLLIGGAAAYIATRAILLAELDHSLLAKASSLLQFSGLAGGGQPVVPPEDRFILRNERGQTLARPPSEPQSFEPPVVVGRSFITLADGSRMRTITLRAMPARTDEKGPVTLVYSTSADRFHRTLVKLAGAMAGIWMASGLLAAAAAWRISRAALAPLERTAQAIGGIDERQLDRRIDCSALPQELQPMGQQLNHMLRRLEQVFAQRRQFLADAAHELRTPVAALLTTMEVTLRRPRDASALTTTMQDCLSSVRVLRRLVDTLLEQARSDAAVQRPAEPVDVAAMLHECAAMAQTLGAEKRVRVVRSIPDHIEATLQPERLRSIVTNLLANAVQYNRPGGDVELACGQDEHGLWLTVSDTGAGIASENMPHIFEPFYRADQAHHGHEEHLGLGLFLVKAHVSAMNGTCSVQSRPGEGTCFRVNLPCPMAVAAS